MAPPSLTHKLAADTLRYLPGVILPAAAALAAVAIFTRIFDAEAYGRYALVIATTATVAQLVSGWIQPSILRYLPRYRAENRLDQFVGETRALLWSVAIACLLLLLPLYPLIADRLGVFRPFFVPGVLVVTSELLLLNLVTIYQGAFRSGVYAAGRGTAAMLRLLLGVVLVLMVSRDPVSLVYAIAVANFLVAIPMLIGMRTRVFKPWPSKELVRTFAAYGLPLIGWMMCSQLLQISDRYIIGAFRGSPEVGIYAASYNIVVMGFGLVSTPIFLAAQPLIMNAWEHNRRTDIPNLVARFSRYYLIAIAPVFAFVWIFSAEIVSIVLGEDFREGHRIMPILLAGVLTWGMAMYGQKGLEIAEKTKILLGLIFIATATNLILNLLVVPRYGYVGAAVTTFISMAIYPLLVYPITRAHIPWLIPWRGAAKIAACAAGTAAVFWGARAVLANHVPAFVYVIIAGLAGLAVYVGLLLATRTLRRDELHDLT